MNPLVRHYRRMKRRLAHWVSVLAPRWRSRDIVRRTDFTRSTRPVLLLYGLFSTRRTLEILEHRLRRDGYGVWSIRLEGLRGLFDTHSIEESAQRVREKVERLYARYPHLEPLTLIGHSRGGLIATYYVKHLGGDSRVRTLVTLGTPHRGTPMAWLGCALMGWASRSVWQVTPVSSFIRRLRTVPFPRTVRVASIYSRADDLVPFPRALLETQEQENVSNVEIPGVRHGALLSHRAVYEIIRHELALGYGEPSPWPPPRAVPPHPNRS